MFDIGIEEGQLAKQMLAIYVMAAEEYWDYLSRRSLEDGLLAITEIISDLGRSEDAKNVVREGGSSNKSIELIKGLEKAVADLHAFVVSE